jgi:Glycosyltransferase family 87
VTNSAVRLLKRIGEAGGGRTADFFLYALSAAFALVTALTSTLLPHRAWGWIAVWGYAAAAVAVFLVRRFWLVWATWAAVGLLPLVVEAVQRSGGRTDRAQEEVLVVERMGERLLHDGTPYLGRDAISALPLDERLMGYSPYQPGMAVFGLPRAAFGDFWWTDARVWFAVVTVAALIAAVRMIGAASPAALPVVRALQAATVFPICALTLATGGDDIPVMELCLLALALVAADRYGWAGVAVGAAAAAKLFAFPVVAVLAVLTIANGRWRSFLPGALGLPILVLIPPFLVDPGAFVENVLQFPLGHGLVTSPAQSPFPGYLIAQNLPGGRLLAAGLLALVALLIGLRLLRQPPRTASAAALICGWGLLAAILLMPTTRFGYLLYPVALLLWVPALTFPAMAHTQEAHSRT